MNGDVLVYLHGRTDYAGCFDGEWWRWPAMRDGWLARKRTTEQDVNTDRELTPALADFAIRASGVDL